MTIARASGSASAARQLGQPAFVGAGQVAGAREHAVVVADVVARAQHGGAGKERLARHRSRRRDDAHDVARRDARGADHRRRRRRRPPPPSPSCGAGDACAADSAPVDAEPDTPRRWPPAQAKPTEASAAAAVGSGTAAAARRAQARGPAPAQRRGAGLAATAAIGLGSGGGGAAAGSGRRRGGSRAHERDAHPRERRVGRLDDLGTRAPARSSSPTLNATSVPTGSGSGNTTNAPASSTSRTCSSASDHHARVANFRSAFHDGSLTPCSANWRPREPPATSAAWLSLLELCCAKGKTAGGSRTRSAPPF